jgi:uncharacterized protein (TIGR03663 family)
MNRWFLAGMALVIGAALGLRAPGLALRPLHNDEGVNAMKFRLLYVNNSYKYDANEFHGPTLPYLTLPAAWLDGARDFNDIREPVFRAVTAVFGAGLIVLLLLVAADFGRADTLWAAALTAVSPAMVFYSRDYIHETLLVFFTALSFFCAWRHAATGRRRWAVAAGIGLGLMWATKETFVFAVAALALAAGSAAAWGRWRDKGAGGLPPHWKWKDLLLALVAALAVAALFFSSFFGNAAGLLDAVRTYGPWLRRAGGATVHTHGWAFYFHRLLYFHAAGGPVWSEGLVVALAAVGCAAGLFGPSRPLHRLVAFYTIWLTLIYTLPAYKTPWCLLGFYHGMILLAGAGAALLVRGCKTGWSKAAAIIVLTVGVAQLGWQAWRGNFALDPGGVPYCDSPKNPYVYGQTSPDIFRLVSTVEGLARVSPQGYDTVVEVMSAQSYWPLPWYLRRFNHAGYWDQIPRQPLAPIMIVSADLRAAFDERPEKTHLMAGYFQLRPKVFFELYVSLPLWSDYVKTLPPGAD